MKDQYFGDINDYKKYSLLRLLNGNGQIKTVVCWALTLPEKDSDGKLKYKGNDGKFIDYLKEPQKWQKYDPVVFDHLEGCVRGKRIRKVEVIERSSILPNCCFYGKNIQNDKTSRCKYFQEFAGLAKGADLIFFDPDNGLEVKSVPKGRKGSSKYIYKDEIQQFFKSGHSILLYQHFPRRKRDLYIADLVQELKVITGTDCVFSYKTSHVVFLLVPQSRHIETFRNNSALVNDKWEGMISVREH